MATNKVKKKSHAHKGAHRAADGKAKKAHSAHASHERHAPAKKMESGDTLRNAAIVVLLLALVAVLFWSFSDDKMPAPSAGTATSGMETASAGDFGVSPETKAEMLELSDDDPFIGAVDAPVTIVEFSDFQCPYCGRFWGDAYPLIKKNFVETGVVKIVYRDLPLPFHANAQKAAEAAQCAHEQGKFWEYHDTLFANQDALGVNNLKKYAGDLGLDVAAFGECLDSGKYVAETQKDAAAAAANGISGTPGFVINGQKVSGAQPYDKFEQVICGIVPESQPCKDIPAPVEMEITILNDARCTSCDTSQLRGALTELFPGATFRTVDAQSTEGTALVEKYGLVYAPVYFLPDALEETRSWQSNTQIQGAFVKLDSGYRIRDEATGASWFLSEEAREAYFSTINDALGRTAGDNKPQVDFFVMSYCPYGNQAEELLKPVFDELKGEAQFNPRYVIYNQGSGCYTDTDGTQLCSLHGAAELNQDVRELCVFNDLGEQAWFDFALAMNTECTSSNADTCWKGVAESQGLDTDAISTCFEENKLTFAREQYELNRMLGVSGSPTLFFEGELFNGARSSNAYLAALCAGFDDAPAACDDVVAEPVQQAAAGNCG